MALRLDWVRLCAVLSFAFCSFLSGRLTSAILHVVLCLESGRYSTYDAEGTWFLREHLEDLLKTRPWAQVCTPACLCEDGVMASARTSMHMAPTDVFVPTTTVLPLSGQNHVRLLCSVPCPLRRAADGYREDRHQGVCGCVGVWVCGCVGVQMPYRPRE